MYDPAQILLFIVIIVLTIFLIILGIQVSLILKDLRKTIAKTNKILDDTEQMTAAVKEPVIGLSGAIMGIKTGSTFLSLMNRFTAKGEKHGK
jgi:hypothetical protein